MKIQSPLSNLRDVLGKVKASASSYQRNFIDNEAATRLALIDPVLTALGWDLTNPLMVEVEKTMSVNGQRTRIDYVLSDQGNNASIVVEAKSLGQPLGAGHQIAQIFNYASQIQANDIILCNGFVWQHFQGSVSFTNPTPKQQFDITRDDLNKMAAYLVQQLDAALYWTDEQIIDNTSQDIARLQHDLATLQQQVTLLSTPSVPVLLKPSSPANIPRSLAPNISWHEIDSLPEPVASTTPSQLRLPDNTVVPIRSWSHLLAEYCQFVLLNKPDLQLPILDISGRTRNLIDSNKAQTGSLVNVMWNGNQVYIQTNYDSNKCVANAAYILRQLTPHQQKVKAAVVYS